MKQIAIRKVFSFFYTNSDEIDSCAFDDNLEKLDDEIKSLALKYGVQVSGGYTAFYGLDKYSICHCTKCKSLMINRDENHTGFEGSEMVNDIENVIRNGGLVDGVLLCEECLPTVHRWALPI